MRCKRFSTSLYDGSAGMPPFWWWSDRPDGVGKGQHVLNLGRGPFGDVSLALQQAVEEAARKRVAGTGGINSFDVGGRLRISVVPDIRDTAGGAQRQRSAFMAKRLRSAAAAFSRSLPR